MGVTVIRSLWTFMASANCDIITLLKYGQLGLSIYLSSQIHSPWLGDKADYGTGLSYRPASLISLSDRHLREPYAKVDFIKGWWQYATLFVYFYIFITFIQYNHPITFIQYIRRGLSPSPHRLWLSGKDLPVVPSQGLRLSLCILRFFFIIFQIGNLNKLASSTSKCSFFRFLK